MEGSVLARIAAIVFVAIAITAAVVEMGRDEAGQAVRPAALPHAGGRSLAGRTTALPGTG